MKRRADGGWSQKDTKTLLNRSGDRVPILSSVNFQTKTWLKIKFRPYWGSFSVQPKMGTFTCDRGNWIVFRGASIDPVDSVEAVR